MKNNYFQLGYGGIEMFFGAVIVGFVMYFFFYPSTFPKAGYGDDGSGFQYCRDMINNPNAPTIEAPSYAANTVDLSSSRTYRMIKQNVQIIDYVVKDASDQHLIQTYNEKYEDPKTGKKYILRFPSGVGGRSYDFPTSFDYNLPTGITFEEYGIMHAYHANEQYELQSPYIADIYKAVDTPPLPSWVLQCIDILSPTQRDAISDSMKIYYPEQNWSTTKAEEQLNYFLFKKDYFVPRSWWVPHCKPAIYLYPQKETKVNVQVSIPNGELLYTDPIYPSSGWDVLAKPNGELQYLASNRADSRGVVNYADGVLPYLYYEGRIADSAIEKPTTGFVVAYEDLAGFYDQTLPKLGLNDKESMEFKDYWLKALPKSPYYFIGVVSKSNLDEIEPLTITPRQDTTIRVSLYFEQREKFTQTTPPTLKTPTRSGFTVVEWGGMVKNDKDHSFTCLQ